MACFLFPPGVTRAVLQVHGYRCRYCGNPAGEADHIIAPIHGGTNDARNLTACCRACNGRKGDRRLAPEFETTLLQEAWALTPIVEQIAGMYRAGQAAARRRRKAPILEQMSL
ncbi:HNH endonuclease [Pseudomonas aeruginosa]|uniref:HNH endonuclease n=1 Tax=Pseudomonas aeruginosa TaxID=287 RepID=UPI0039B82807